MKKINEIQVNKALEAIDGLLTGMGINEYNEVLHELILSYLLHNDLSFEQKGKFMVVYVMLKDFLTKIGAIDSTEK